MFSGSLKGDTTIIAGQGYEQIGSTVSSPEGDVSIAAQSIDIQAAMNTYANVSKQAHEQKGLTITFSSPVTDLAQQAIAVAQSSKQVGQSKNGRVNAMAAANAGWQAYQTGKSAQNLANGTSNANQVSISITYGEQKNQQATQIQASQAQASQIIAGKKATLIATGAGEQSNIAITGSDVAGKEQTALFADNNTNLQSAEQSNTERSNNKSSGWNAGVAITGGQGGWSLGITAGGNVGKGHGNGDDTIHRNSHIGNKVSLTTIQSGGDTTLKGAQVIGKGVQVNAKNLSIQSVQDSETYQSKQQNANAQVTVGYGFSASGNYSQSKINASHQSVSEQSGIYACDDGYQINIKNHTDLKGGIITSTQSAEDKGKNQFSTGTLTYQDIENHSNYSASGFGVGGGVTVSGGSAPKEVGGMQLQQIGENHKNGASNITFEGIAGVASQGNWGVTKGLFSALLGQVNDKGSENGVTSSYINTKNIHINNEDEQLSKTGKTAQASIQEIGNKNLNESVTKTDVEQIRTDLDRDLSVKTEFANNINEIGDDIYYKMEKNEDSIFSIQEQAKECNHMSCLSLQEGDEYDNSQALKELIYSDEILSEEDVKLLSNIATAGMLNLERKNKVSSAILYADDINSLQETPIIANRGSAGFFNEYIFTAFERFRAWANMPSIFGASNATRDKVQILKKIDEYNAYAIKNGKPTYDINMLSHSLGVSGDKNMLNWSEYLGQTYPNTNINFTHLGGSYSSKKIDSQAKEQFKNVSTKYTGVEGDFVYSGLIGHFIGNNDNAQKPTEKMGFKEAHSDGNQNINNLRFVYDENNQSDVTNRNETEKILNKIYKNGIRKFNVVE